MYQCTKWNLNDLLKSPKEKDIILKEIEKLVDKLEKYKNKLKPSISETKFYEIIKTLEIIKEKSAVLEGYAGLWSAADTKSQEAKVFESKIDDKLTNTSNRLLFISLWWKNLDNKNAERLMKNAGDYKYYLELCRKQKKYTLSETEEKIINIKDTTGSDTLVELYEMLKTGFKYNFKGKEITESELTVYVRNNDPKNRELSYRLLLDKYKSYDSEFGYIYQIVVRDYKNECIDLRGYKTPISVCNNSNDLPDNVVETLLDICKKNVKVFQRYFKLKARLLGVKTINRYDIYAPIDADEKKYDFNETLNLTYDCYKKFSPEIYKLIKRVIEDKHLDSELRPTKIGGAFCASIRPKDIPYVLVNFTGTARDVATLAHELGHAAHSMLASKHSILNFYSSTPLCETASTFGEMLLSEELLKKENNKQSKINLLTEKLDDIYSTVARQAFFVIFEKDAHEAIAQGATVKELCDIYYKNLQKLFGDAVIIPEDFRYEWLYIPHIYNTPFYCYSYAFGNLLVLALYEMYKKEGSEFVPKYLQMLSHGGSKSPTEILKEIGVDPSSEKFWQQGFDFISELVDELEELTK